MSSDPADEPTDAAERETVCGLGNRKNDFFAAALADEGVEPYAGSVELLDHLAAKGTQVAVVSSSRNAPAVLEAACAKRADERIEAAYATLFAFSIVVKILLVPVLWNL